MNVNTGDDSVFKRIPEMSDISFIVENISSALNEKLTPEYIESVYRLRRQTARTKETKETDAQSLKESIRLVLKELSTNTTAKVVSGISRFVKRPYAKDLTSTIVAIYKTIDHFQDECFQNETTSPLSFILFSIFLSRYLSHHFSQLQKTSRCHLNVFWYYGHYDSMIDAITEETDEAVYWIDESMTWTGYNDEGIVVVPVDVSTDTNVNIDLLKTYVSSVCKHAAFDKVHTYYLISSSPPTTIHLDNPFINLKKVREFPAPVPTKSKR